MIEAKSTPEIFFPKLPVWKGVTTKPGALEAAPFRLVVTPEGLIRQPEESIADLKIFESYQDDSYEFITAPPGASAWADRLGKDYVDFLLECVPQLTGRRILDIGGGSVAIAKELTSAPFDARDYLLVDPSVRTASPSENIRILREFFPPKGESLRDRDLIISFNCLEHVPDPFSFARKIWEISNGETDIVLAFPDVARQFGEGDLNALLHEHISCFTMSSATALFRLVGLSVQRSISRNDCLFYHLKKATPVRDAVHDAKAILLASRDGFSQTVDFLSREVGGWLRAGERIAFHGANNGLNNALFLAGLSGHVQISVFDGDDSKSGKFLPTISSPIRHSADSAYREFDRVVISALTFYDECHRFITQRHGLPAEIILPLSPLHRSNRKAGPA